MDHLQLRKTRIAASPEILDQLNKLHLARLSLRKQHLSVLNALSGRLVPTHKMRISEQNAPATENRDVIETEKQSHRSVAIVAKGPHAVNGPL